ncbi:hypothetical protein Hamer_G003182 [Homarus americanus]|uniref:Uncharacterized protein n=1 Tax=Homarus americanus TaxID=6706 RepID=A0A8J5N6K7_HOMAM|nr:hypothetical protein Hamer_G003182 [Homarus americanus]
MTATFPRTCLALAVVAVSLLLTVGNTDHGMTPADENTVIISVHSPAAAPEPAAAQVTTAIPGTVTKTFLQEQNLWWIGGLALLVLLTLFVVAIFLLLLRLLRPFRHFNKSYDKNINSRNPPCLYSERWTPPPSQAGPFTASENTASQGQMVKGQFIVKPNDIEMSKLPNVDREPYDRDSINSMYNQVFFHSGNV